MILLSEIFLIETKIIIKIVIYRINLLHVIAKK